MGEKLMERVVRERRQVPREYTWSIESVFASPGEWETAFETVAADIPRLSEYAGHLGDSPETLLDWIDTYQDLYRRIGHVYLYASMLHNVDTGDAAAKAMSDRARGLVATFSAASAYAEPELIAAGFDTLRSWIRSTPDLAIYEHYVDSLEKRQRHVRSAEVEEILGLVHDPFGTASATHSVLADTDLCFAPALTTSGEAVDIAHGNLNSLLADPDRELRRTTWESYSDAHLAMKNTMANCLSAGIKQDVFMARARRYSSSLEAALDPNFIPAAVFYNLIDTFKRNLPTWHKYWRIRRRALGYDALHVYDIKAPLTSNPPHVPYETAVDWISAGMRPLGDEYVEVLRRGTLQDRWVDIYPNQRKTSGAYSSGWLGTRPFILMSYADDIFSMSTLAHELGHSLHSYFTWQTQPAVYSHYGMFAAETASNFNQALVRAHLLSENHDPDFQIAVIEEAMSNFHRYFFIMPTLARFELDIHERVERGQGLAADDMIQAMADLFAEGYGDEVVLDRERIGITWAEFSGHMYANFYVFQYATGISAAHALAHGVLEGGDEKAADYLRFLRAGSSLYPLDALKVAGVDMESPEPVERTFGILDEMVDRLEGLVG